MPSFRAFIAIPLPAEIRGAIREFTLLLRPRCGGAKWERSDKLHVTMKFLGETDEGIAGRILREMDRCVAGLPPFELVVSGFGAFPSMGRPRILWIGCDAPGGALAALNLAIEERMAGLGFEREERAFHPHVTIARVRDDGVPPHLTSLPKNINFDPHHTLVTELHLMKSVLKPAGSEYAVIGSSRLS